MPNGNWLSRSSYMPLVRKHVMPSRWPFEPGTDFWLIPGPDMNTAEDTGSQEQLPEWGWTSTSLVDTQGSAADFMASADKGDQNHILTNATGDLLQSPSIFGDYSHAWQAMRCAGMNSIPKKLVCEFWGSMSVHSANEPTSGWGLFEDGGSADTEADQLAFISSDSSNFQIARNGGTGILEDTGLVDGADWNLFTIEVALGPSLVYWYVNGALQGSIAITADEFPCFFGMHALTTNRPLLGVVHIYYSWSGVGSDLGAVPTSAAD